MSGQCTKDTCGSRGTLDSARTGRADLVDLVRIKQDVGENVFADFGTRSGAVAAFVPDGAILAIPFFGSSSCCWRTVVANVRTKIYDCTIESSVERAWSCRVGLLILDFGF